MPPVPDRSWPDSFDFSRFTTRRRPLYDSARPPLSTSLPPLLTTSRSTQPIPPLPPLRLLHTGLVPVAEQEPPLPSGPLPPLASRSTSSTFSNFISTLDEIGHSLDNANSHLRTLLDLSTAVDLSLVNQLSSSSSNNMLARPGGGAGSRREPSRSDEGSRLAKRRRLDSDKSTAPAFKGFRYGRYGQVEPGKLTMEIVSCDGGLYSDGGSYAAENILKSDNSVYCTKGNRCNIVLQHQGCTTFSLKELIIKAPGRNYSSPVRQGLVFFSMTKDELVSTNQFQAEDVVPPAPAQGQPPTGSPLDTLRVYTTARMTAERLANALDARDTLGTADGGHGDASNDLYSYITSGYDEDATLRPRDPERSVPSHFQVMTECSDDENDEAAARYGSGNGNGNGRGVRRGGPWQRGAGWSPTPLRSRSRRRLPTYEDSPPYGAHLITWDAAGAENYEENEDEDDYTELYELQDAATSPPDSPRETERRNRGRLDNEEADEDEDEEDEDDDDDDEDDDDEANEADVLPSFAQFPGMSFQEAAAASGSGFSHGYSHGSSCPEVATPYARFHIENNRTKCTIHFDPPVTARYILLKMWNPRQDLAGGNIDIQGVVAKGYAGPRYFPSLELR